MEVVDWINGLPEVRRAVKGWRDIESYALERGWEGAYEVPKRAANVGLAEGRHLMCISISAAGGSSSVGVGSR